MIHNNIAALFLLVCVGVPIGKIVWGSVQGKYDNPERPKRLKSREPPLRDMREERAGFVENKIERFKLK